MQVTDPIEAPLPDPFDFVLPQPTEEGVAEFQANYEETIGTSLSEGEAREALSHLMTIVWQCARIEYRLNKEEKSSG